ncbi:MAG: AAA family ATPase [Roseburia sp.]|nr:AAA family ATPase [Roseburia sp.]
MHLFKIIIQNYRLLVDAELDVDKKTTLIVGRNNTAKTSCIDCIDCVLKGKGFSYDDYPLVKREELYNLISQFMEYKLTYQDLSKKLPIISIEFYVDYSLDEPEENLGTLSPFIIDVEEDVNSAIIRVEYQLKIDEVSLRDLLKPGFYVDDVFTPNIEEARNICIRNFKRIFGLSILAINPKNILDTQVKSQKELSNLFPFYSIPAERVLGEDGTQNNNSLGEVIASLFTTKEEDLSPDVVEEVKKLRKVVEDANKDVQKNSDVLLSSIINKAIGFGYPNGEELQLAVNTQLNIDDQIKSQTELAYKIDGAQESLPSSYNGLGYKNLIKMEFILADIAQKIDLNGNCCIPLLFIEEPESHMHPQMQHLFAKYIENFLSKITNAKIQTFLTSHSAHIANTIEFSKIRYAQKTASGVVYKNLDYFSKENSKHLDFIKKYLTLSRCDLFFADKVIFVEGASERLLLPDMINKCDKDGLFEPQKYKLPAQYYAMVEIGGAYAYKFIPFINFLGIPCLILTDIDSMKDGRTKSTVTNGNISSNATLKWWMRQLKNLPEEDTTKIPLSEIVSLTSTQKTQGKCHIEFQTREKNLCGRSLEEAIKNVNRDFYGLSDTATEDDLEFDGKSKTDFALNLICDNSNYEIPKYVKDGLAWLNSQKVLE